MMVIKKVVEIELDFHKLVIGDRIAHAPCFSVSYSSETMEVARVYFGTPRHGPVACYHARLGVWVPCWSNGNFGLNHTNGGTWFAPHPEKYGVTTLKKAINMSIKDSGCSFEHRAEAFRNRSWIKKYADSFLELK